MTGRKSQRKATAFKLPFPPPQSACFQNARGRGRVKTQRYKEWETAALWEIKRQKPILFDGPVSVHVELVAPDKRKRDADNLGKAICDALVKSQVIEDDNNSIIRKLTLEWVATGEPCLVKVQAA